jgi:hypothetical protein
LIILSAILEGITPHIVQANAAGFPRAAAAFLYITGTLPSPFAIVQEIRPNVHNAPSGPGYDVRKHSVLFPHYKLSMVSGNQQKPVRPPGNFAFFFQKSPARDTARPDAF